MFFRRICQICGAKRFKLSPALVCQSCQENLRRELRQLFAALDPLEQSFERLKSESKRIEVAEEIIARCRRIMEIEARHVFILGYDGILPSQWLIQYEQERDWAMVHTVSNEFEKRRTEKGVNLYEVLALSEEVKRRLHQPKIIEPLERQVRKEIAWLVPESPEYAKSRKKK